MTDIPERDICGWRWLQEQRPAALDDWSSRHLDVLAALEAVAAEAVAGDTLLHLDVRADNLLLTPERVFVVDWPHACVGAAWVDTESHQRWGTDSFNDRPGRWQR